MRLSDLSLSARAPFSHLIEDALDVDLPNPTGWFVMVLQYIRPDKSAGGLFLPDSIKREDEYQGRCGVVLALGPDAYSDVTKYPGGPWVKPGDHVLWPTLETSAQRQKYGKMVLAFLPDDRIVATGVNPAVAVAG